MYNVALCDDNKYDNSALEKIISELQEEGTACEVFSFSSGVDLIKAFEAGDRFHLLVLDMVMEPINGIETAKKIREFDLSVPILIVTSTTEYALDGYQVDAWRYLTKPVDKTKFLNEVRNIFSSYETKDKLYYIINNSNGLTKVLLDDIIYFDSDLHTITVHTMNNSYSFRGTIGPIEQLYREEGFFRIHKSYLVNLKYIKNISKSIVTLINGEQLDLSKKRVAALHDALLDYTVRKQSTRMGK